jgi:hypothetical protein
VDPGRTPSGIAGSSRLADFFCGALSGQSGSALPASQSAADVRPPRASASVAEYTNAISASAANARPTVNLRIDVGFPVLIGMVSIAIPGLLLAIDEISTGFSPPTDA